MDKVNYCYVQMLWDSNFSVWVMNFGGDRVIVKSL